MTTIAETETEWSELLGSKDWANLLDPFNLSLRTLILRCGDFCQATYDAFINDQNSKYCGTSRYGKSNFFEKVMFESGPSNYQISSFLYATAQVSVPQAFLLHSLSRESWDRESNWIGYIAITSDDTTKKLGRREIYVVWRGTTRNYEWVNVLGAKLKSVKALLNPTTTAQLMQSNLDGSSSSSSDDEDNDKMPKTMLGWLTIYTSSDAKSSFTKESARTQLVTKIKELTQLYENENPSIVLTGHSLGASLAILSAFDLVENGVADIPVTAIVFGSPQVGNKALKEMIAGHTNLKILHVRNVIDLLTHYPGRLLGYKDLGVNFVIDTRKSPYLKDSKNPGDWHNLQAMLHIVAGWNGDKGEFGLRVKRSLALVNKSCDFLKDECLVPAVWWVEKNKGMVRNEDGDWVMALPDNEDMPSPASIV